MKHAARNIAGARVDTTARISSIRRQGGDGDVNLADVWPTITRVGARRAEPELHNFSVSTVFVSFPKTKCAARHDHKQVFCHQRTYKAIQLQFLARAGIDLTLQKTCHSWFGINYEAHQSRLLYFELVILSFRGVWSQSASDRA